MNMKSLQVELPFWVRAVLLAGVFCIVAGAGLIAYRFYRQPVTLTVAVGSVDGEARKVASLIAGRLATSGASVRLKVVNSGSVLEAAKAFAAGQVDLAVVREDVGDLSQARTIAMTAHGVVMIVAPPGSAVTSIAKLRGHTVGVVGGDINQAVVDALKKEYDLGSANVTFKNIAPTDARRAVQAKEVQALLLVLPLTDRNLSFVRGLFREGANSQPVLIPIDSAGAIADTNGAYESFDIPKGTLRGAPPVPDDDVTTLRVGYYLVANRKLDKNVAAELAKRVMAARRDIGSEEPALSGLAAPDLDADAYLSVHPGAAAFFNGTQESFMDRYSNVIYLTPMVLGALASIFAAAWRFLGVRADEAVHPVLDAFCALPERIRNAEGETQLREIEQEVDGLLRDRLARTASREEGASEAHALIAAAQRLDNLIHHRRTVLVGR
jgi:TRAP-type uncharacterized transport system substrate-binding protein